MKQLFVVLLSATILLCGCSADEANIGHDESGVVKKEQYAIYHDYSNDEDFQIPSNNNYYDTVVEQATLAAAESKSNALPEGATRTIDLIFYQLPTEAAMSSSEDMDYVPVLALSVFSNEDKQYATIDMPSLGSSEASFEMPESLSEAIGSMVHSARAE